MSTEYTPLTKCVLVIKSSDVDIRNYLTSQLVDVDNMVRYPSGKPCPADIPKLERHTGIELPLALLIGVENVNSFFRNTLSSEQVKNLREEKAKSFFTDKVPFEQTLDRYDIMTLITTQEIAIFDIVNNSVKSNPSNADLLGYLAMKKDNHVQEAVQAVDNYIKYGTYSSSIWNKVEWGYSLYHQQVTTMNDNDFTTLAFEVYGTVDKAVCYLSEQYPDIELKMVEKSPYTKTIKVIKDGKIASSYSDVTGMRVNSHELMNNCPTDKYKGLNVFPSWSTGSRNGKFTVICRYLGCDWRNDPYLMIMLDKDDSEKPVVNYELFATSFISQAEGRISLGKITLDVKDMQEKELDTINNNVLENFAVLDKEWGKYYTWKLLLTETKEELF